MTAAPLSVAILLATMGVTVADDHHALCLNGVQSVGKGYISHGFPEAARFGHLAGCCPRSCGESCGGVGCDTMPGGPEDCCVASFVNRLCDYSHETHCLVPPRGNEVRLDALSATPANKIIESGIRECKARSTSQDRFVFPVYGAKCDASQSGGNNMLVWFHAVALAHVQKRTLLAPPWYNIPANETWDLNRLSAGGLGLVRVESSFCHSNVLRDSPAACTAKATALVLEGTRRYHNKHSSDFSNDREGGSKARGVVNGHPRNTTQQKSAWTNRHSSSKEPMRNEVAINSNRNGIDGTRAKIDRSSRSSGGTPPAESKSPPPATANTDSEMPEWLRVATQSQQQRRLSARRSKVDGKSPGGPMDGHLKRSQRHYRSKSSIDSDTPRVDMSHNSDSSTSSSQSSVIHGNAGNALERHPNAALPRCHGSRTYTLESLGESSRRVVAIAEPDPTMDVYTHHDPSDSRPLVHYPPVLPPSFIVDSASGGIKQSSTERSRGEQSAPSNGGAVASEISFHPSRGTVRSVGKQSMHAAISNGADEEAAWAETKWGDSSVYQDERTRSSDSNRVKGSRRSSTNRYDLTWSQGDESEVQWRRQLASSNHIADGVVVPTVLQNLRFAAPVRQRAAAILDALGVATTRDRAAGHATFGLLVAFVDIFEPSSSEAIHEDNDASNRNREHHDAMRRHLTGRELGSLHSTSGSSIGNEFALSSSKSKCDRRKDHSSRTGDCRPASLLDIADRLAEAALATKRHYNKELATWRSNNGDSGAEEEPAIAYLCTEATPYEVEQHFTQPPELLQTTSSYSLHFSCVTTFLAYVVGAFILFF